MSSEAATDGFDAALRKTGAGLLKSVYWLGAGIYNRVLVNVLGYRAHLLAAEAFAAHWPGGPGPVLDIGCGTGLTADALLKRVRVAIDGVDFSAAMLDRARSRGIYRELIEADVTRPLPVEPRSYAGAVSSGLFTHGHVGAEALEPLLGALAPDAIFAFTVYSSIWKRGGFEQTLATLEESGRIAVLSNTTSGHFSRFKGQTVHVLAIRVL